MARHTYGYTKVFDGDADPVREDHYRYVGMTNATVVPARTQIPMTQVTNTGPDNSFDLEMSETRPGASAVNPFHSV